MGDHGQVAHLTCRCGYVGRSGRALAGHLGGHQRRKGSRTNRQAARIASLEAIVVRLVTIDQNRATEGAPPARDEWDDLLAQAREVLALEHP